MVNSALIIFLLSFHSLFALSASLFDQNEKSFVIVIPSYNNIQWYQQNLDSALAQRYSNYRIIYINDHSMDGTGEEVEKYLEQKKIDFRVIHFDDHSSDSITKTVKQFKKNVNNKKCFFTLVNNLNRCGALENLYRAIYSCQDEEIIVTLDGDDWFYHKNVIKNLNKVYSEREVWFTHGTLIEYPSGRVTWCEPILPIALATRTFRQYKCPSHLRTFYTWLFKKIKLEDFLFNGKFFFMSWDMAIMFPLCEMAMERHSFVEEVNYVYNMANPINANKVDAELQRNLDVYIRNMPPYPAIPAGEDNTFKR